jgi:GGDEF domain-containing protein
LATPLLSGTTLVGVLSLYSSNKDAYSEEHQRVIEVIARQVSPAILGAQNSELNRTRSLRDETTGLPNLRHLLEFVEAQLAGDGRDHPLSLITISFVPGVESTADKATASIIGVTRRALRPADLLFRTGADELVAVLLNTERASALAIKIRMDGALNSLKDAAVIGSCRIGQAFAPTDSHNADRLLDISRRRRHSDDDSELPPRGAIH